MRRRGGCGGAEDAEARSSSDELRSSLVGARKFPVLTVNFRDAQFVAPPRQLRLQNFVFQPKRRSDGALLGLRSVFSHGVFGGAAERGQTNLSLCGEQ